MARAPKKGLTYHPEVLIELYGMKETIRGLGGIEKMLDELWPTEKRKIMGKLIAKLSPAVGVARRLLSANGEMPAA